MTRAAARSRLLVLGSYSLFVGWWAALSASRKPFHFDELCTWYAARQPSFDAIWSALAAGADVNPVGFYLVTRLGHEALADQSVAHRLPAMAGFWLMGAGLYFLAERRGGPIAGAVALLVPFSTFAVPYAYEARPYALVLGCASMALLCYQLAADRRARPLALAGLALFLALAVSSHYYAVLLVALFGLAELARSLQTRAADPAIWACMAVSGVPLLLHLPLIRATAAYSGHFWNQAEPLEAAFVYRDLIRGRLFLFVALAFLLWRVWPGETSERFRPLLARADVLGALALAAFPALSVVLGILLRGFTTRYALPGVVGIAALLGLIVAHVWRRRPAPALVFAALLAISPAALALGTARAWLRAERPPVPSLPESVMRVDPSLPVVVASSQYFFPVAHYAPPEWRGRLVFLADPERAARYLKAYTDDRVLAGFAGRTPLRIEEYEEFVRTTPRFLLFVPPWGANVWLDRQLAADGAELTGVDAEEGRLFLVTTSGRAE